MDSTQDGAPSPQQAAADPRAGTVCARAGVAPLAVMADRAAGVLVGQAVGNALGVPYEFKSPKLVGSPRMSGGGLADYAPGEWSDDTQLAICIAEVGATGADLTTEESLDAISARFLQAVKGGVREVDAQTRVVLDGVAFDRDPGRPAQKMRRAAAYFHRRTKRSAANGALSRCAVIGLTRIEDPEWTAAAARTVAELTHVDPLAGDSCVLLAEAVRRAVTDPVEGSSQWLRRIHIEAGLQLLPRKRQEQWAQWLAQAAEQYFKPPMDNTFTVTALQAALGAIVRAAAAVSQGEGVGGDAQGPAARAFSAAVSEAVRIGGDTDTVAAITGALMGAVTGAAELPARWVGKIHGWPGLKADGLADLAVGTALGGILGEASMAQVVATGLDLRALIERHSSYLDVQGRPN